MTLFSFLSDTILTHGNDNVNMNVLKYSEKGGFPPCFGVEGVGANRRGKTEPTKERQHV